MRIGDSFNLYKKIKEAVGIVQKAPENILSDTDGNLLTNIESKFEMAKIF